MAKTKVVIAGAGLAGLTAALDLQSKGYHVQLFEANSFIGGRTASWDIEGMEVESGLHRILGFYKEFPRLVRQGGLKMKDVVIWEDELEIKVANGPSGVYGASLIFRPFKTLSAPFRNRIISWKDTLRLARFMTSGLSCYFTNPQKLDTFSVTEYAKKFNISNEAQIRILWPFTAGLFFLPPERYSAFVFFSLIAKGIKRPHRIRVGAFTGGMTEVLANPLAQKIEAQGGQVYTRHKVQKLVIENNKVTGILVNEKFVAADFVILAVPVGPAQQIIKSSGTEKLNNLLLLPTMPEINLQLELSAPAWPVDRTVFGPGTSLITFAEQSRTTFKGKAGRLSVILAPPEQFINLPHEEVFRIFTQEAPFLGIDPSKVVRYRVVSHPRDFYLLSPGVEALKPGTFTGIPNLFLAGDYIKQPFLATMEGAIISGRRAAKAVMG
ncbi:MAG TPA: FAD-dependent oxidoreductase [Bacteroidia bacterium]|nr:FAD-dependent oxidoreductase [Bacteroidia bacterium]